MTADAGANDKLFANWWRPGASAYWIFVPALGVSSIAIWAKFQVDLGNFNSLFVDLAPIAFVPAFVGLISRALGRRIIASICAVIVVVCYWIAGAFATLLVLFVPAPWTLVVFVVYGIPAITIAVAATFSIRRKIGRAWAISAVCVGSLCTVALVVSMVPKTKEVHIPALDPNVLGPDILMIDKCSHQFAASREKSGYPESLHELGPGGTGCLPEELIQGTEKGFTIRYDAGTKEEDGKILSYTINARETSPRDKERSSMFSDESGLIRYRFDGPLGQGSTGLYDPPIDIFGEVLGCLWSGATNKSWGFFDGQEQSLVTDRDEMVRRYLQDHSFSPSGNHEFRSSTYKVEYKFTVPDDGTASGFYLKVRPLEYGVAGIRSYLAVSTIEGSGTHSRLKIFATAEDRPATTNDPLAIADETGVRGEGGLANREN